MHIEDFSAHADNYLSSCYDTLCAPKRPMHVMQLYASYASLSRSHADRLADLRLPVWQTGLDPILHMQILYNMFTISRRAIRLPLPCIVVADRVGQHGPRQLLGWRSISPVERATERGSEVNLALCRLVT